jgi:hypothetical protein
MPSIKKKHNDLNAFISFIIILVEYNENSNQQVINKVFPNEVDFHKIIASETSMSKLYII